MFSFTESAEVCRQCIDCGVRYGYKKRTKDIVTWAKKRKRFIKREELIAFLLNKPEESPSELSRMEDISDAPNCCGFSGSVPSPRRRLICREDLPLSESTEQSLVSTKDLPRKRQNSFGFDGSSVGIGGGMIGGGVVNGASEFGPPLTKRIKF